MIRKGILAGLLLAGIRAFSQDGTSFFFASAHCRDSVKNELRQRIRETVVLPLSDSTAGAWSHACWAMELMLYRPEGLDIKIPAYLEQLPLLPGSLQRDYLEMIYTLYPGRYRKEMREILPRISNDKVKAMAWEYLAVSGKRKEYRGDTAFRSSRYFEPFLYQRKKRNMQQPSIADFLDSSFLPGQSVLCSFQYRNRNKPGFLMIRTGSGNWLLDEKGEPLRFPQLARAISNLPFYLTNGNTPQGLYRITGTGVSENNWIGPTHNLQMELPFETGAETFFGRDTAFLSFYASLLGNRLQSFPGLYESFTAGRLGRTEIIAHGTAIDPRYYEKEPYYPNTPSLGCLCSPEWWNKAGERTRSAQLEWMNVYRALNDKPKYLVVAEISLYGTLHTR